MQLFVRGSETHALQLAGSETVSDIKSLISEREGFPVEEQIILYAGKPLQDEYLLSKLNDLSTLDIEVRMLGGKVHGSLARAGKVKGQTPKVEKQEKKKQKTGRAKRRMQYNRRFGVVVSTFGRRKGPNANS
ncbi:ubiquitin-like FUBI-ribosomal protein eS30 fusion protein [Saccostrea echinata]|uniref:ubiquitin-like FUBI-ribosomal protein eS30 fusion protein n=1 Tax=Saccostrea echinata TaxID=191078 RepID=UPI002A82DD9A|nr:ubiquitin-like FUBI-ribosomal protein eS30 fusion protein [Saccostrea echinata]